jgi:hypothetical protein
MGRASSSRPLSALIARLNARRPEIEQAALTRLQAVPDQAGLASPAYVDGLRTAVSAAIDQAFAAIEHGERQTAPPIPIALLNQARLAARDGKSVDSVLRRYLAGHALLTDFIVAEAKEVGLNGTLLQRILRDLSALFDRLTAAAAEEYAREADDLRRTSEQHRSERIQGLLDGEPLDTSDFAYDFDAHHLGAVATARASVEALRDLAKALDRRLLLVRRGEACVWAWLGGQQGFEQDEVESVASRWPGGLILALGEPADGLAGWRLTHRQALATLPIAMRGEQRVARYAQAPLLASALQDELLATTLRQLYLVPLEAERDDGAVAKATLRAYFATGNISSAAAVLGVNRRTVSSRIAAIEERFGRSLGSASAEIETALRLDEIEAT